MPPAASGDADDADEADIGEDVAVEFEALGTHLNFIKEVCLSLSLSFGRVRGNSLSIM